ncbi:AraC family transcriptional regulator [Anaerohalosphaera lusitana]|nr:AraC family transcriptional regulator [Anaerohalosphaera lusitana]
MRWDLYLTGAGAASIAAEDSYPPQGHPSLYSFRWETGRTLAEYQILLIAEGHGVFESAKNEQTQVKAGDVIFLYPDLWHRYRPDPSSGWKEYWLSWNGERLYRLMKKGLLDPNRGVISVQHPELIAAAFEKILKHVKDHPAENSNVLSAYAMEVLTLAMDDIDIAKVARDTAVPRDHVHSIDDPVVFKALQTIWNHSYRDIRVDDLIEMLPITRRTLERKFKESLGCSIGTEIKRCRLERAKHLLANTTLPIKHIALAVGFSSTDRMGKVFKESLGMTPSQYRKSVKDQHQGL